MEAAKTRVSSKGQVVIPSSLREVMGIKEGDEFEVFGRGEAIVLRRIDKDTLEKEFEAVVAPLRKKVKGKGIKRSDLDAIIRETRGSYEGRP